MQFLLLYLGLVLDQLGIQVQSSDDVVVLVLPSVLDGVDVLLGVRTGSLDGVLERIDVLVFDLPQRRKELLPFGVVLHQVFNLGGLVDERNHVCLMQLRDHCVALIPAVQQLFLALFLLLEQIERCLHLTFDASDLIGDLVELVNLFLADGRRHCYFTLDLGDLVNDPVHLGLDLLNQGERFLQELLGVVALVPEEGGFPLVVLKLELRDVTRLVDDL